DVVMLSHHGHPVIRPDEHRRQLASRMAEPRNEGPQRAIDQPIALDHLGVEWILKMGDPVDPRKYHQEETPRLARGIHPSPRDAWARSRVRPGRVRARAEKGAPPRAPVAPGREAAGERRANRNALWDEIEQRRTASDIAVHPTRLRAAVAARGAPLFAPAPTRRRAAAIEPPDPRNPDAPRIAAE